MAKQNVQFTAAETVAEPTMMKFKTKSGGTVFFRALKTVEVRVSAHAVR